MLPSGYLLKGAFNPQRQRTQQPTTHSYWQDQCPLLTVLSPGTSPTVSLWYLHVFTAQENTFFLQLTLPSEVKQVLVKFPEPKGHLKAPNPSLWKQLQQLSNVALIAFSIYAFERMD